jgi:hypothetical protein
MGAGVSKGRRPGVKRVALFHDTHLCKTHWPTWECAIQWITHVRPDLLVLGGDIFDLPNLGNFAPDPSSDLNLLPELRRGVMELNRAIAAAGETVYVMGNHEDRWLRSLVSAYPRQFYGLPGLSFPEQLRSHGLDERCTFVEERPGWPGVQIGHVYFRHGHHDYKAGGPIHVAAKLTADEGGSASIGHVHRTQLYVVGRPGRRTEYGVTGGTMESQPKWGPRVRWSRGWQYFEVDEESGYAHPYPILCEQGRLAWGGQVFDGNAPAGSVGAARAGGRKHRPEYVHHDGRTLPELAQATGIAYRTLASRVERGWTGDALTSPVDPVRSARRRAQAPPQRRAPPA